ncbi:MAG: hypothetical protein Tsb0010_01560 [Parvularculaceae bacterium]
MRCAIWKDEGDPMASTDYHRGEMDIDAQDATYRAIMKFTGMIAVPFCLALVVFFASLLLDLGIVVSFVLAILTFVLLQPVMRVLKAIL